MILEGNTSVVDAIKEKKRLMEAGEAHEHIKPLLIVDGGLMKGAYGVGAGLVFEEEGYTKTFSNVVGVSSGAASGAYFVGGNVSVGATLIYEECCSSDFMNLRTFSANTEFVTDVLKGKTGKAVLPEKIFASDTNFYVGVSEYETAIPKLIQPQTEADLFDSLHASILMPTMSTYRLCMKGVRYVDGGFSAPHIIELAVESIPATHVLILTNQNHFDKGVSILEHIMIETFMRFRMNKRLRYVAHRRKGERFKALNKIGKMTNAAVATVWGDGSIEGLERDSKKVKSVVDRSKVWWQELLAK